MTIIGPNFKIESCKEGDFFNLSFLTIVNKDKEDEREEYKISSYGIPFNTCLERIAYKKLDTIEGNYSVDEFLDLYEEIVNDIGKLIAPQV